MLAAVYSMFYMDAHHAVRFQWSDGNLLGYPNLFMDSQGYLFILQNHSNYI